MVAGGQDVGRRRFSLAHELGHYHMPSHASVGLTLGCVEADFRARSDKVRHLESQANDFATELLMPDRLFSRDVAARDMTFESVAALASADMYDVSLTAAAWRLVETTKEKCALIVAVAGKVQWAVGSDSWGFPLRERHSRVPVGSMAHHVIQGEQASHLRERIDPDAWLASSDGRYRPTGQIELYETTHAIPRLSQVMSLLWAVQG